ncbi:DNA helicase IV [Vibrio sp. SS-MA-C1-2]|uniref:DNA helicase IV n=1 Tax=Vibrio sp. SS-MA-C1-2 TaxID=2908646 RepID=UPI001F18B766|nr:DNA helicase IV [Vibrio sp. SS-MA-C1-2]UJF18174.1 DNA helicase IV [Vibrio sp. SS-MA-C1-2]
MEINASRLASLMSRWDFSKICLNDNQIRLLSSHYILTIPFECWNGDYQLQRGLRWGRVTFRGIDGLSNQDTFTITSLTHFSRQNTQPLEKKIDYRYITDQQAYVVGHQEFNLPDQDENEQYNERMIETSSKVLRSTVYGLPWQQCAEFCQQIDRQYQQWHKTEMSKLDKAYTPLIDLIREWVKPSAYLRSSQLEQLQQQLTAAFIEYNLSFSFALKHDYQRYQPILCWINQPIEAQTIFNRQNQVQLLAQWQPWLDSIESHPLNSSQVDSLLCDEDANLILAGAGSGKTSVLAARAAFLLASEQAEKDQILMLAFGNKAAKELSQRVKEFSQQRVLSCTFHHLAMQIIKEVEGNAVKISSLASDKEQQHVWLSSQLEVTWQQKAKLNRWLKHIKAWPLASLKQNIASEEQLNQKRHDEKLLNFIWRLIMLLVQNGSNKKALQSKIDEQGNEKIEQLRSELELIWPLYKSYLAELKKTQSQDFNTLISLATKYAKSDRFKSPWHYIMVDEYQDISPERLDLIDALCFNKNQQQTASIFAVGDDWQAIYQFAGAKLALTTEFSTRFVNSEIQSLDTTYRFNNMIGEVANLFIQQNPSQLKKVLNSFKQQKKKAISIIEMKKLEQTLQKLPEQSSVLILARNNRQLEQLAVSENQYNHLQIEKMTCHSSKGREAEYVFIIDVDEGIFPPLRQQRGLESVLLSSLESFEFAEERRLFYVALTRAKKQVWLCCDKNKASPFIRELVFNNYNVNCGVRINLK